MEERRLGAREGRRGEGEAAQLLEPASCIALASRISDLELRCEDRGRVAEWRVRCVCAGAALFDCSVMVKWL